MKKAETVNKSAWQSAKARFQIGDRVQARVSEIASFGLLVEIPDTLVPGVVIAIGFKNNAAFAERAESHPVGSPVDLIVIGASDQRFQIDLRLDL